MNCRPLRILFQGDSITDAFRRPEEINPAYQLGNGFVFLVAARLAIDFPGRFECLNRGVSGNTVSDLLARWDEDAIALRPDVLSLLIGVNSTIRSMIGEEEEALGQFRERYHELLSRSRNSNPGMRFLLVEPFLLDAGKVTAEWRAHLDLRRAVVREMAEEFGAVFVGAQEAFLGAARASTAEYFAYDGIHPTHAGAALLADEWIAAVLPALKD